MEKPKEQFDLDTLRHSTSHIMANAITNLYPGTKLAIGPSIEDGFYYDIEITPPLSPENLPKIEKEMHRLISGAHKFVRKEITKQEAKELFKDNKYKLELIDEITDEKITLYENGKFVDMCRGPHIESTNQVKFFKLLSLAGAYWRGSENENNCNVFMERLFLLKKTLMIT
jgi:threonyl-tRNA synthetase